MGQRPEEIVAFIRTVIVIDEEKIETERAVVGQPLHNISRFIFRNEDGGKYHRFCSTAPGVTGALLCRELVSVKIADLMNSLPAMLDKRRHFAGHWWCPTDPSRNVSVRMTRQGRYAGAMPRRVPGCTGLATPRLSRSRDREKHERSWGAGLTSATEDCAEPPASSSLSETTRRGTSRLSDIFPELAEYTHADYERVRVQKPTLAIAISARTGSTHLCGALAKAGQFGAPTEIFNPRGPAFHEAKRLSVTSFEAYLAALADSAETALIFKSCWLDFVPFKEVYKVIFPRIRFLYLDRLDIAAQAASLFRATLTGDWHNQSNRPREPSSIAEELYDLDHLRRVVESLQQEKLQWGHFFAAEEITPPRLIYEEWHDRIAIALHFIALNFGFNLESLEVGDTGYLKISDPVVTKWADRLRVDLGVCESKSDLAAP